LGKALLAFFVHGKEKSFMIHTKFVIVKKSFLNPLSLRLLKNTLVVVTGKAF
jgi:hypothetical protein